MSNHSDDTLTAKYTELVGKLSRDEDKDRFSLPESKGGTYKSWISDHDGEVVDTLQVTVRGGSGDLAHAFTPFGRTVEAHGTYVNFMTDGSPSRRDYSGVRVLACSDDLIVAADNFGDDSMVIAHQVVR